MAKDKEEKPKMSKGKKIIAGLLVALTIAGAAVGAAIAITNSLNNTQGNIGPGTSFTPGQEEPGQIPGGDVNDPVIDQGGDNGGGSENLVAQENMPSAYLIRRLTPLECERLQGFPDGWTDIEGASDSSRYKALGNSVAIPCVEFIMHGLALALKAG